ncbi:hypothetical protein TBLA_0B02590 [Henningerozyma blattae CBS 6284]|uniref:NADPH-dependent diflavin oxidoreductase 1 n=1 Tax=Henningerozyma blattae (strain ATCC 34711 / CBS 6284 / DSM 70876 / NBRC 10599 / NRRL Y-10934 / UCD 77-7) TaxID=1071380 RepID=I2GY99_HENB6|nr:hypothetical protein TBLA_0B02590 [Tetrapisispora blattae CBS 6284]CCH59101.1 hypothetical protein TBLA_0B02590 [Tetrapisispora blattae CBS 6284]
MAAKKIALLYGSETGNAHDFATVLSHKLHRLHFDHTLSTLADYNIEDIISCKYLFIICSTTGQGELPRNVWERATGDDRLNTLWSFLKKKQLPTNFLNHINVGFLGLGDFSYPKFNYAIRMLEERIVNQLGANEIFDRLEADEISMAGSNKNTGAGIESVYFEFEKKIVAYLMDRFPNRKVNGQIINREPIDKELYLQPPSFLELDTDSKTTESLIRSLELNGNQDEQNKFLHDSSIKYANIVENVRITSEDHFQDIRKFVFKGEKSNDEYSPGDTAAIFPCNSDEAVMRFLDVQPHWKAVADKPLKFTNGIPKDLQNGGVIEAITLRNLLKYHFDISSVPRSSFFLKVWMFATDQKRLERGKEQLDDQREKLYQFGTSEDMQDLFDYCNRPRRSILEVLEDFLSLRLPWEYAADYLPIIKPRLYSISSAPNDPCIELTVAIVKYRTILRHIRKGVCTTYMSSLNKGDRLRYKIFNNNLLVKKQKTKPWILVSPGVGIAPMMSFIRSDFANDITLYFGNRYFHKDFIYRDILENWDSTGKIKLYTCFSRDREASPDVKYVQDILWKHGKELTKLIVKQNAYFYLCGSSGKMPVQVRLTFVEMLKKWGEFSTPTDAEKYLSNMEKEDRYLQETW